MNMKRIKECKEKIFCISVDCLQNGKQTNFYMNENNVFSMEKNVLYTMEQGIVYNLVVENTGYEQISIPIVLHGNKSGVFIEQKTEKLKLLGNKAYVKILDPGQKKELFFMIRASSEYKKTISLIKNLNDSIVCGYKAQ